MGLTLAGQAWRQGRRRRARCCAPTTCPRLRAPRRFAQGWLCDALLAANQGRLAQLTILGNSFHTYQERWSAPAGCRPSSGKPEQLLALVEAGESKRAVRHQQLLTIHCA